MKATAILIEEHGLILQVLDYLSRAQKLIETNHHPHKAVFDRAVSFSRDFTDKYHHYKEEYILFDLLAEKTKGIIKKQLNALKFEHERGCHFIESLSHSIDGYADSDAFATITLLENLASYVSLMKKHIFVVDHFFFPMVEKEFSVEEDRQLTARFQEESEHLGGSKFMSDCFNQVAEIDSKLALSPPLNST